MNNQCFHCEESIPTGTVLSVEVNGQPQAVCCIGCQAVAQSILAGGFDQYYQFRSNKAPQANKTTVNNFAEYDETSIQQDFVTYSNDSNEADIAIEGMHCAACAWLIEQRLSMLEGIEQVRVNSTSQRARIRWQPTIKLSKIFQAINEIGYQAFPFKINQQETRFKQAQKGFLKKVTVAGLMTMQVMMLAFATYSGVIELEYETFFRWISLLLTIPVITYSAYPILQSAIRAISNKTVNMDVPVAIAILGTFFASILATVQQDGEVYYESVCMFTFLLLLGRYLEHNVRSTAATVTANMLKLIPLVAMKKQTNGHYEQVSARQLKPGDIIQVKEGTAIPADGIMLSPHCFVDESMLSGESEPVAKSKNTHLYAGSILSEQTIELAVTAAGNTTTLYQMANSESELGSNSSFVSLADKIAKYFVTAVLVISAFTFFSWHYFTEQSGFWPMVAVLVATCPCALSLAMPTAMVAATTRLKREGILVNQSAGLEALSKADIIVFDKTGTLTQGTLSITNIVCLDAMQEDQVLQIVASIEKFSNHPIATAFKHISTDLVAHDIHITAGLGISATIDHHLYKVGSYEYVSTATESTSDTVTQHQSARLFLANEDKIIAAIYLADPIRHDAQELLAKLPQEKLMFSGDRNEIVQQVAHQLNIEAYGNLKPHDKVNKLRALQQQGKIVGMVGDGINDSAVLQVADVSIAVNNANDLSKQKSDMILLGNQLNQIYDAHLISCALNKKIKQNISWAIAYNSLVLPLACLNILSPYAAVFGMSLSSLLVVINSTRLLKK